MFTDAEHRYLRARAHGRLATMGPGDNPQVHPVSFVIDGDSGCIEIGGRHLRDSQKYRNIRRDPRVSLVVDDDNSPPLQLDERSGRGIEIRGIAEVSETTQPMVPGFDSDIIRIRPVRIDAWNLDDPGHRGRFVT
jgi:pyridoxamine 5'-phosphate oxidase family protein